MNLTNIKILEQNITLLYESIDPKDVDTRGLKTMLKVPVQVVDTPEMILAIYPVGPTIIQIADNRIRITSQKETGDLNNVGSDQKGLHLWRMALEAHRTLDKPNLIAYGFNYRVGVTVVEGEATTLLNNKFMLNISAVSEALQAEKVQITPRVKYHRGETEYDLILEALDEKKAGVHLNAHFKETAFPTQKVLKASFQNEFEYLMLSLQNMFQGEG